MARLMRSAAVPDVRVDASTIDLAGESSVVEFEPDWTFRYLVESDPDGEGLRVLCGQECGGIAVTAELWDGPPPLEVAGWQDVAEISTPWESPFLDFATTQREDEDEAVLRLPGPGDYRVRVHGRNRDDGDPRRDGDPTEEYLIQIWRAPLGEPARHKATSALFTRWRTNG